MSRLMLQQALGLAEHRGGTGGLSPDELIHLLKTMTFDADAGEVRRDPDLGRTLEIAP